MSSEKFPQPQLCVLLVVLSKHKIINFFFEESHETPKFLGVWKISVKKKNNSQQFSKTMKQISLILKNHTLFVENTTQLTKMKMSFRSRLRTVEERLQSKDSWKANLKSWEHNKDEVLRKNRMRFVLNWGGMKRDCSWKRGESKP